jgi:hypothetical protein
MEIFEVYEKEFKTLFDSIQHKIKLNDKLSQNQIKRELEECLNE